MEAAAVHNQIRGMNPWPGSFTYHRGNYLRILLSEGCPEDCGVEPPGTVLRADREGLVVSCGTGVVRITRIQASGKKPLGVEEFLNGYSIKSGDKFGREDVR